MNKLIIIAMIATTLSISCDKQDMLIIASKNFTENIILSEMMGVLIDAKTDIDVKVQSNFGGTFVIHKAMQSGEIDIYPDYTGTLYQTVLKETKQVSPEESFAIVKREMLAQYNQVILDTFGFNNTYAIGLLRERAATLGLKKISDMKDYPQLIAGFDSEFIERADGGKKMLEVYGIELQNNIVQLEIGLRYQAIIEKKADFTDVFTTDAKIKRFDLTLLEDDLNFFPAYYAIPVIRKETLDEYPQLESIVSMLANTITEEEMVGLNFAVEEEDQQAKKVAEEFLVSKGIL